MSILTNPVTVSVIVLCVLCLFKLNILAAMLVACYAGALVGGIPFRDVMGIITEGFSSNAETALAYLLLGTFATAIATTGLADIMGKKMSRLMGDRRAVLLLILAGVSCLSQNLIPIHIAFIPIMIPPMLAMFNRMKLDRRSAACSLAFGLKAPYIAIPFGFGTIFHGIIAKNMTENGMPIEAAAVWHYTWHLGVAMFIGLLIAIFISYAAPREYKTLDVDTSATDAIAEELKPAHWITVLAIFVVVAVQIWTDSLPVSALSGLVVMFALRAVPWSRIDDQFAGGIKIMGMIAFVMLIAGGYAGVMKQTGGVDELVHAAANAMSGNKVMAATMITLIGLLVTMGIGTSFGTIPVLAVLYVPLCKHMGFSTPATCLLIAAAAALGDAGSPASDTTLGPTAGLNADGQHDHIWDTCVPTFLHFNIPLMVAAIILSQYL